MSVVMQAVPGGRWTDSRAFSTAVLLSLFLHGALLFSFTMKAPRAPSGFPGPIIARLAPASPPAAPPSQAQAEPSQPRAEAPAPLPPVEKPSPKPLARAAQRTEKPVPAAKAGASTAAEPAAPASSAPPAPQPASSAATDRATLAKVEPSPAPAAPSADEGTLDSYRIELLRMARHYKRYPRVAMDNNWEGKVVVKMVVGGNGMISGISVLTSAGYEVLDKEAVDMIRKAKPLVPIPGPLRGKEFSIEIPVIYSLKEPG